MIGILPRQDANAGNIVLLAEVHDQGVGVMGMRRAVKRMPDGISIAVDGVFRAAVFRLSLLTVNVSDFPAIMRQRSAMGIEHIDFRDRGEFIAILGRESLQAEIARFPGGEGNFPRLSPGGEGAFFD